MRPGRPAPRSITGSIGRSLGRRSAGLLATLTIVLLAALGLAGTPAGAQASGTAPAGTEADGTDPDVVALLDRYRPVVMIKSQDGLCSPVGEPYRPISPRLVLANPQIALRQLGSSNPVVGWGPTAETIGPLGGGFYLDLPGDALDPECLYATDSARLQGDRPPVVLGRVVSQVDRPGYLVAQYWLYWYYNDWNNKHESDWEGIQLVFRASSVAEALATEPVEAGYAQHDGGERADWTSAKLEKDGPRPVVYSSRRSHASYYGSSLFMGRSATEGFGCDNTDGPSTRLDPELEVMPATGGPAATSGWVRFTGRWGERGQGPNNGPQGPITKLRWDRPLDWQDSLRDTSFIVPAGDSGSEQLVASFCRVVAFGSNQLNSFQYSPTKLLVILAVLVILIRFLVGRTGWDAAPPLPLVQRRRVGQAWRGALTIYRRHPLVFIVLGVLAIPVGMAAAAAGAVVSRLPFIGGLVLHDERNSSDLFFAGILGGLATMVGITLATGAVARIVAEPGRGLARLGPSLRFTARRLGALVVTTAPAIVGVVLLGYSFIGLPLAVLITTRLCFVGEVVVLEGRSGLGALRRSSALVKGRWLQTVVSVALIALLLQGAGLAVGLVALVLFTSLPLWLLAFVSTLVQLLLVPMAALVMALLYGDAVANDRERATAPDTDPLYAPT